MNENNGTVEQNTHQKFFRKLIYINAFITGAVVMAMEMTGSRFLTPFFGSSVYTWASIISMVLLSLSAGYFAGGYWAERKPYSYYPGYFIYAAGLFILFIPLYYVNLFNFLYDIIPDTKTGGFVGALLTLFLPMFLLGMYSPYSIKLSSADSQQAGKISGTLYAISTIGSIVGTLGVTFILIPIIGIKSITITLSLICVLSGMSLLMLLPAEMNESIKVHPRNKKKAWILLIVYVVMFSLVVNWDTLVDSIGMKDKTSSTILEEIESDYNNILIKQKGEYITMGFYHSGANHLESSINTLNENELPLSYAQIMPVALLYMDKPTSLLMVGFGGGVVTKYIQNYFKNIDITGVDLDDKVIEMAQKYFGLVEKENYKVNIEDGRIFLHRSKNTYDIIMLDAYKGGYIPFHLCTKEFYEMVEQHLNNNGCVVLNLHRGSKLFPRMVQTLGVVFENIDLYGSETKGNAVAVAYNGHLKSMDELSQIADSLQKQYNFYHNISELISLKFEQKIDYKQKILTDDFAPINFLNAIDEYNIKN